MLAIAFAGCACRCAFYAGVAAALDEGGVKFQLSAGASSGALCAAAIAAGRARELPKILRALSGRSIVSLRRLWWNRSLFDMSHIVRSTLREHLATTSFGALDLREGPAEALISVTRLRDFKPLLYSSRLESDLLEPLLGSCFIPMLYGRTVSHRGHLLVDGGLTDNLPIEALFAHGADEVIAVVANPDASALKRPFSPRWRYHDEKHARPGRLHVIHPRSRLALRSWDFHPDRVAEAVDEGLRAGRDFLGQ